MKGKSNCAILAVCKSSGLSVIHGGHDELSRWCWGVASSCPYAGTRIWPHGFLV